MWQRLKNLWEWSKYSPNWVSVPKDAVDADWLASLTEKFEDKLVDKSVDAILEGGDDKRTNGVSTLQ